MAEAHEDRFTSADPDAAGLVLPPAPKPARRFGRSRTVLVFALLLASGIGLGRLLGGGQAQAAGATTGARPMPPVVVTVPAPAPRSCVDALHLGDASVDLLVHGIRDRRLSETLKAYAKAANACRKEVPEK